MCIISWHHYSFYIMVNWIHIIFYISSLVAVIRPSFVWEERMFMYVYTNSMYECEHCMFISGFFFCTSHIYMSISQVCKRIQQVFMSIFYVYSILLYLFIWGYFYFILFVVFLKQFLPLAAPFCIVFTHCLIPCCRDKLNFSCGAPIKVHLILSHLILFNDPH